MIFKYRRRLGAGGKGKSLILPLQEVGQTDVSLAGGKAVNLALLIRAKLNVPAGFCITSTAFREFLESCPRQQNLGRILSGNSVTSSAQTARLSEQVLACLDPVGMPTTVEQAILTAWRQQGTERIYAVRSSATVEDAANHSFAGQFESFLNICGQHALLSAVRACWLSLFSERALAYHARNALSIRQSAMAVLVQEMVPAEVAGIMFTMDPTTGEADRIVIEAAPGLGESVVSGRVVPEKVILAKPSFEVISRHGVGQNSNLTATTIDESMAQQLATLSRRVEALLPGPLDIEWAICNRSIYLLQARPATCHKPALSSNRRQIWSNGNSGEALPDPLTPMTHSLLMPLLQGLLDNLSGHLGFRIRADELLNLIAGRPYFNLNMGVAMLSYVPGVKAEDVGDIFGGAHESMMRKGQIQLLAEDLPRLRFYAWQVVFRMPPVMLEVMRFLVSKKPMPSPVLMQSLCPLIDTVFEHYSDDRLLDAIHDILPLEQTGRHPAVRLMGIGAFSLVVFFAICKRWFGAEGPTIAARLTTGLGTLDPAEAGRDLWRLAEFAEAHAGVRRTLEEESVFAEVKLRLLPLKEGKEFLERWDGLLARHGHHARGELELMNPRWCETPDIVLALLRHYVGAISRKQPVPAAQLPELGEKRIALERDCLCQLTNPCKRILFRWALRSARRGIAIKENVKSALVRRLSHARLFLLELGRRMVCRGRLSHPNDVFFLRVDELRADLLWSEHSRLDEIISARRAEYEGNLKLNPPPVVVGDGDPRTWQPEAGAVPGEHLEGLAVSPGIAVGPARVILKPGAEDRISPGEILVAPSTDPAWSPYFLTAAGVAIDLGGVLSHGSILAREYGLPAVTNLGSATRSICTGDLVRVDGTSGQVTILKRASDG